MHTFDVVCKGWGASLLIDGLSGKEYMKNRFKSPHSFHADM
jgi:hypothetical protein